MEMHIVIKSLGIVLALTAVVYIMRPDIAKRLISLLQKGKRIYLDGILNFALASVFVVGARDCKYPWLIFVCGMVFMAESLIIFILGPEKTRPLLYWSCQQSEELFQYLGLVLEIVGIVIILST